MKNNRRDFLKLTGLTGISLVGKVSNSWKVENHKILMDVDIPANTRATIYLPAANADSISESGKKLSEVKGIKIDEAKDGYVEVETGSGEYHFIIDQ